MWGYCQECIEQLKKDMNKVFKFKINTCWNCCDPIPEESNKNVCRACEQMMNREDSDED
jgi:hypothetical protein